MYSKKVMQHFTKPHNVGEMKKPHGVGEVGNMKCGDIMKLFIKVKKDFILRSTQRYYIKKQIQRLASNQVRCNFFQNRLAGCIRL